MDKPATELISEHLLRHNFSQEVFLELKLHRQFIIICDGYDECRLAINLHSTNLFNQPGQWKVKMIISCRSNYLSEDYRDMFQPQPPNLYSLASAAVPRLQLYDKFIDQWLEINKRRLRFAKLNTEASMALEQLIEGGS
ncbi:hypothetical protein BGX23_009168 [Mortierella sp. AD031]|nr:hypothetical protein BGX23_009168 [Mortierella sp. AD031]